jgi:hypothetical protein
VGKLSEREDQWQAQATCAAITAARRMIAGDEAAINPATRVSDLSDIEWSWLITAAIFAWISTRAEQAASEGADTELAVRAMGQLKPWDAGAIASTLPRLADTPGMPWARPIADWSRDQMTRFLTTAVDLARKATLARDIGGLSIIRKPLNEEIGDSIPF